MSVLYREIQQYPKRKTKSEKLSLSIDLYVLVLIKLHTDHTFLVSSMVDIPWIAPQEVDNYFENLYLHILPNFPILSTYF